MRRTLAAAAALACALALASGARLPREPLTGPEPIRTSLRASILGALQPLAEGQVNGCNRGKERDCMIMHTIRYTVPPSELDDFEEEWMKFREDSDVHKGLEMMTLKSVTTNNVYYYQYEEWSSWEDLREHIKSKHFEKWMDFVDDHEIRWDVHPLEDLSADIEEDKRKMNLERHKSDTKEDKDTTHILIYYDVEPSMSEDFIDEWTECAKETIKEDANVVYSLRRVKTTNSKFYTYGTWESMRDFQDHFESKHVGRLLGWAEKNDIEWFMAPLRDVEAKERHAA